MPSQSVGGGHTQGKTKWQEVVFLGKLPLSAWFAYNYASNWQSLAICAAFEPQRPRIVRRCGVKG
jgi:hypothetical protein